MPRILIIDDEQASCRTLKLHFTQRGFDVDTALSAIALEHRNKVIQVS